MTDFVPLTRDRLDDVDCFVRRLVARPLLSVGYRHFPWAGDDEAYERHAAQLDHDLSSVVLGFDDGGQQAVAWVTLGWLQCIGFPRGPAGPGHRVRLDERFTDVSASPGWSALVGRSVTAVGLWWHDCGNGAPESVWAVQLSFEGAVGAMIALGEVASEGNLRYSPDDVVVWFPPHPGYVPNYVTGGFEPWVPSASAS